jgi:hypothetical protein
MLQSTQMTQMKRIFTDNINIEHLSLSDSLCILCDSLWNKKYFYTEYHRENFNI